MRGMERPSPVEGHRIARRGAGLFDASHQGWLEVTGADRVSWLHQLLTNDIKALTPGHGCPAALLTPQAKVRGLFTVLARPEALLLECEATLIATLPPALLAYRISERVELRDRTRDGGLLWLQGPASPAILAAWAGEGVVGPRELDHAPHQVGGVPVLVIRHSVTGDAGFQIRVPSKDLGAVREALLAAGRPMGLAPCGMEAWESLRIEAGIPRYGRDVTERDLLPETGWDRAVRSTTGCYLGQEFVARIRDRGHITRRLSLLALDSPTPAPAGAAIHAGETDVGSVTSSAFVPTQERALALGYLHRDCWAPGTALTIECPTGPCPATVILPFPPIELERAGGSAAASSG